MAPATILCPIRGYRRQIPAWENRDMTVCIAAICEEDTEPKVILCTDTK